MDRNQPVEVLICALLFSYVDKKKLTFGQVA